LLVDDSASILPAHTWLTGNTLACLVCPSVCLSHAGMMLWVSAAADGRTIPLTTLKQCCWGSVTAPGGPFEKNMTSTTKPEVHSVSCRLPQRDGTTRCYTPIVLYTQMDGQCNKLATVVGLLLTTFATIDGKILYVTSLGQSPGRNYPHF